MFFLQIIIVIFLLGWIVGRRGKLESIRNYEQLKFRIQQEIQKSKNQTVKNVLTGLLADEYMPITKAEDKSAQSVPARLPQQSIRQQISAPSVELPSSPAHHVEPVAAPASAPLQHKAYVDNTSLLLYFGAFLFIAAVGIFVGFAEVEGAAKTFSVGFVAAALYLFGFWLFNAKRKLRQVGEAFIGIGMTIVPFVGVTAYNYSADQANGAFIWMATSIVALLLYALTIIKLRTVFVSYLLVGSIVSLLLSFVGIVEGPVHYFIWAIAFTGIVLQLLSMTFKSVPNLNEASHLSSQLFAPLAIIGSLIAINESGVAQVAVTTGLTALYYGLLAFSVPGYKKTYLGVTHTLTLMTIVFAVYSIDSSLNDVGAALMAITVVHLVAVFSLRQLLRSSDTHLLIMLSAGALTPFFFANEPRIVAIAIAVFWLLSSSIAFVYKKLYAGMLAMFTWIGLSYVFGQLYLSSKLTVDVQAIVSVLWLLPLGGLLINKWRELPQSWKEAARDSISVGLLIALAVALFAEPYTLLLVAMMGYGTTLAIELLDDETSRWNVLQLLLPGVPVVYAVFGLGTQSYFFTIATTLYLLIMIVTALRSASESARWLSTISWLLLPIALMTDEVGIFSLSNPDGLLLYGLAIFALSVSRAIARGKIFLRATIPLAALARSTSSSYVTGMWVASFIVTILAFNTDSYWLGMSALIALAMYLFGHYRYVEKSKFIDVFLPIILQIILLRLLEPYFASGPNNEPIIYPLVSMGLGLVCYAFNYVIIREDDTKSRYSQDDFLRVALVGMYIAPLSFLFTSNMSWAVPFSAIVASIVTLFNYLHSKESTREWLGGLVLLSIFWLLGYQGIDDIQIYAHLTAALFALYAIIRNYLNDKSASDNYLLAMLLISTIPLALEAISGSNRGEFLGLWLLFEQIGFMLLGISFGKPLLTKWGLYVGVAAVLYQLRDLGWAMLAVLSLFLIGVAVYRALKQPDDNE